MKCWRLTGSMKAHGFCEPAAGDNSIDQEGLVIITFLAYFFSPFPHPLVLGSRRCTSELESWSSEGKGPEHRTMAPLSQTQAQ